MLRYLLDTEIRPNKTVKLFKSTMMLIDSQQMRKPLPEMTVEVNDSFSERYFKIVLDQMYEDHNEFLHGSRRASERILSSTFIRKYIQCARALRPVLTKVGFIKDL